MFLFLLGMLTAFILFVGFKAAKELCDQLVTEHNARIRAQVISDLKGWDYV